MHLKKIGLKNIKSFADLELDFTDKNGEIRRWTTLFGKNGLGKSTLLQAIGVALAGPAAVRELLPVADGWVRRDHPYGEIVAELLWTKGDSLPPIPKQGKPKTKTPYSARYIVTGDDPEQLPESLTDRYYYTVPTIIPWSGEGDKKQRENATKDIKRLQQTAYAEGKNGWLACGYGPFRRLSGGGQEADRILYSERISSRFITLFREDAALTNTTEWLLRLHNTAREGDRKSESALKQVRDAFANNLFPEATELLIDAKSVLLKVGNRNPTPLSDLSDGYRSMLALGIDLLRWLIKAFPDEADSINCHGVVLIDELDAHLHPAWQRQIGYWLREKFPNLQFIVATHSPFLAQVADVDKSGLLEKYSEDSSNTVLEYTDEGVKTRQNIEPVGDLRVDQILQTPLFDLDSLYSPVTEENLRLHQELFREKQSGKQLSEEEEKKYEQLSIWRENLQMLTSPEERSYEKTLGKIINQLDEELAHLE